MNCLRIVGASCLVSLAVLFANACTKEEGQSPGPASAQEEKKDPIELTLYYGGTLDWTRDSFDRVFGEAVRTHLPHITIHFYNGSDGSIANLLAQFVSFDLVLGSVGVTPRDLLDTELRYDISDMIKQRQFDLTVFDPAVIEAGAKLAEGGLYGLPLYLPPSTIYYNKDLFDRFGVPYPQDGSTWDEMYELSRRLTRTDDESSYYGFTLSFSHQVIMNQWSIPMTTPDDRSTFDTDLRWNTFAQNLLRIYRLPGYDQLQRSNLNLAGQRNLFSVDRTAAMHASLTSLLNQDHLADMNWDLTTFPLVNGNGPQPYPNYLYVTSMNQHKEDTFDLLALLTSEEFQLEQSIKASFITPLRSEKVKSAFSQESELYRDKNIRALRPEVYATPIKIDIYTSAYNDFEPLFLDVILNNKDLNTMLREAAERANSRIDTIKERQKQ